MPSIDSFTFVAAALRELVNVLPWMLDGGTVTILLIYSIHNKNIVFECELEIGGGPKHNLVNFLHGRTMMMVMLMGPIAERRKNGAINKLTVHDV